MAARPWHHGSSSERTATPKSRGMAGEEQSMRHLARTAGILVGAIGIVSGVVAQVGHRTYMQTNLVSDVPGLARRTDPNLVNPWGVAQNPETGLVWVADNGMGVATVYAPNGQPAPTPSRPLVVTIPPPGGGSGLAAPTGLVFNPTTEFVIPAGGGSGPSRFLVVTEDGTISGWNPAVDPTHAILKVDRSTFGAVYKGATLAETGGHTFLYVANFCGG